MKKALIIVFAALFILSACAAKEEEPVSTREPKSLITKEDYEDLKIKKPEEEPVEVDYSKGKYRQNFDPLKKQY